MDKYKIKDLKERLAKETNQEHKNKMLYMWVKQDHISLQEYNSLVINHSDLSNVRRSAIDECYDKFIERENEDDFTKWMNEQLADS